MPRGRGGSEDKVYLKFREWLLEEAILWAVISLPAKAFEPYGSGAKTSVLIFQKKDSGIRAPEETFFGRARFVGYKLQRQKYEPSPLTDLPYIESRFKEWLKSHNYDTAFYGESRWENRN